MLPTPPNNEFIIAVAIPKSWKTFFKASISGISVFPYTESIVLCWLLFSRLKQFPFWNRDETIEPKQKRTKISSHDEIWFCINDASIHSSTSTFSNNKTEKLRNLDRNVFEMLLLTVKISFFLREKHQKIKPDCERSSSSAFNLCFFFLLFLSRVAAKRKAVEVKLKEICLKL